MQGSSKSQALSHFTMLLQSTGHRCGLTGLRQWGCFRVGQWGLHQMGAQSGCDVCLPLRGVKYKISARVTDCIKGFPRSFLSPRFCDLLIGLEEWNTKWKGASEQVGSMHWGVGQTFWPGMDEWQNLGSQKAFSIWCICLFSAVPGKRVRPCWN